MTLCNILNMLSAQRLSGLVVLVRYLCVCGLIAVLQGSGNLRLAVILPDGEDLNEWLAVHGVFVSEILPQ